MGFQRRLSASSPLMCCDVSWLGMATFGHTPHSHWIIATSLPPESASYAYSTPYGRPCKASPASSALRMPSMRLLD